MTRARRQAIVTSSMPADWVSCRSIGANLRRAHERAAGARLLAIDLPRKATQDDLDAAAEKILAGKIETLSFVEHLPHPLYLIRALLRRTKSGGELPKLRFHVYGDFTYYSPEWLELFALAKGRFRMRFLCASDRQAGLLKTLLGASAAVAVCPFAVETRLFRRGRLTRAAARKEFRFDGREYVLIYTGRISLQKNVTLAIDEAFRFFSSRGLRLHFVLAGDFDDLGAPFFAERPVAGRYFQEIESRRLAFSRQGGRLTWLGSLSPEKLRKLYVAADGFMSLSLHHDEDFGMSPAEALSCGLPCLLSDWGGFRGFAASGAAVSMAPVRRDRQGHFFERRDLSRAFGRLLELSREAKSRRESARVMEKRFSVEAVAEVLRADPEEAYSHAPVRTPLLRRLSARLIGHRMRAGTAVFRSCEDPLYRKVYGAYFGDGEKGRR